MRKKESNEKAAIMLSLKWCHVPILAPIHRQKAPARMHGTSAGIEAAKCPDKAILS
jgi:hypothetical protein